MKTFEERFWTKVHKTAKCWTWTGSTAGGYGHISVGRRGEGLVYAHVAAYLLCIGDIPDGYEVDHICNDPACVNPKHLRLATHAENERNRPAQSNNTSGYKGVSWNAPRKKWQANITANGRTYFLGRFSYAEEAGAAYRRAQKTVHGEFAYKGGSSVAKSGKRLRISCLPEEGD